MRKADRSLYRDGLDGVLAQDAPIVYSKACRTYSMTCSNVLSCVRSDLFNYLLFSSHEAQ